MNIIDGIIILLVILGIIRGLREGLLQHGLSLLGFFAGLFMGSWLARHFAGNIQAPTARILLTLLLTLGTAGACSSLGELIGMRLRSKVVQTKLGVADKGLGGVLEIIAVLALTWLGASVITSLPDNSFGRMVRASAIVQQLNDNLPPAPNVVTGIEHLISPNGFPKVFVGNEPNLAPANPATTADAQAAMDHAALSTVKIEGQGCGGIVEGSGFIARSQTIITNAHVVAGITSPTVIDQKGTHQARVVLFDPNLDIAILHTSGLAGPPLALEDSVQVRGTTAIALGYPGGGGLTAAPAAILGDITAVGRNIYNEGITRRDVYQLNADIEPGNSGGPLVLPDGTVVGVVFAKSTTDANLGYALTMPKVLSDLQQVGTTAPAVTTGSCAE